MSRLTQVDPANAPAQVAGLFDAVQSKLGMVPNMMRAFGNSATALRGYLDFSAALGKGTALTAKQRELIALAVAEANGCEYCLAAHTTIGGMVGLNEDAIRAARRGEGTNDADAAVVRLALAVIETRGAVADGDLVDFINVGFDDDAVTEVVANVALNVLTNYFNRLVKTDIDFPTAAPLDDQADNGVACASGACGV